VSQNFMNVNKLVLLEVRYRVVQTEVTWEEVLKVRCSAGEKGE
jgi:hypothetical protein